MRIIIVVLITIILCPGIIPLELKMASAETCESCTNDCNVAFGGCMFQCIFMTNVCIQIYPPPPECNLWYCLMMCLDEFGLCVEECSSCDGYTE